MSSKREREEQDERVVGEVTPGGRVGLPTDKGKRQVVGVSPLAEEIATIINPITSDSLARLFDGKDEDINAIIEKYGGHIVSHNEWVEKLDKLFAKRDIECHYANVYVFIHLRCGGPNPPEDVLHKVLTEVRGYFQYNEFIGPVLDAVIPMLKEEEKLDDVLVSIVALFETFREDQLLICPMNEQYQSEVVATAARTIYGIRQQKHNPDIQLHEHKRYQIKEIEQYIHLAFNTDDYELFEACVLDWYRLDSLSLFLQLADERLQSLHKHGDLTYMWYWKQSGTQQEDAKAFLAGVIEKARERIPDAVLEDDRRIVGLALEGNVKNYEDLKEDKKEVDLALSRLRHEWGGEYPDVYIWFKPEVTSVPRELTDDKASIRNYFGQIFTRVWLLESDDKKASRVEVEENVRGFMSVLLLPHRDQAFEQALVRYFAIHAELTKYDSASFSGFLLERAFDDLFDVFWCMAQLAHSRGLDVYFCSQFVDKRRLDKNPMKTWDSFAHYARDGPYDHAFPYGWLLKDRFLFYITGLDDPTLGDRRESMSPVRVEDGFTGLLPGQYPVITTASLPFGGIKYFIRRFDEKKVQTEEDLIRIFPWADYHPFVETAMNYLQFWTVYHPSADNRENTIAEVLESFRDACVEIWLRANPDTPLNLREFSVVNSPPSLPPVRAPKRRIEHESVDPKEQRYQSGSDTDRARPVVQARPKVTRRHAGEDKDPKKVHEKDSLSSGSEVESVVPLPRPDFDTQSATTDEPPESDSESEYTVVSVNPANSVGGDDDYQEGVDLSLPAKGKKETRRFSAKTKSKPPAVSVPPPPIETRPKTKKVVSVPVDDTYQDEGDMTDYELPPKAQEFVPSAPKSAPRSVPRPRRDAVVEEDDEPEEKRDTPPPPVREWSVDPPVSETPPRARTFGRAPAEPKKAPPPVSRDERKKPTKEEEPTKRAKEEYATPPRSSVGEEDIRSMLGSMLGSMKDEIIEEIRSSSGGGGGDDAEIVTWKSMLRGSGHVLPDGGLYMIQEFTDNEPHSKARINILEQLLMLLQQFHEVDSNERIFQRTLGPLLQISDSATNEQGDVTMATNRNKDKLRDLLKGTGFSGQYETAVHPSQGFLNAERTQRAIQILIDAGDQHQREIAKYNADVDGRAYVKEFRHAGQNVIIAQFKLVLEEMKGLRKDFGKIKKEILDQSADIYNCWKVSTENIEKARGTLGELEGEASALHTVPRSDYPKEDFKQLVDTMFKQGGDEIKISCIGCTDDVVGFVKEQQKKHQGKRLVLFLCPRHLARLRRDRVEPLMLIQYRGTSDAVAFF